MQGGNIPSQYNGTLTWPMAGDLTQNFGCTGVVWEPPKGSCPHFHNGIDLVAPYGTPVKASGDGVVVYIGWNYADGPDPAWIVIIAHSDALQTWYAHMQPRYPGGLHAGSAVAAARSSASRATPATRPARTSTGASCSTATSSTRACSCSRRAGPGR